MSNLIKTKKGLQTHQNFLRKLIRDERLQPSRRLLAEMVLLAVEGHIPWNFVETVYGNPGRIQWNERGEGATEAEAVNTNADQEAQKLLRNLYGGLHESANDSASDQSGS